VTRGEVWWYEPPAGKRRPVCILTRDAAISVLHAVLIAPATTTVRGIATEVELDRSDGLPSPCALSLDNVRTVPKAHLTERVTRLSPPRLRELCRALRVATAC